MTDRRAKVPVTNPEGAPLSPGSEVTVSVAQGSGSGAAAIIAHGAGGNMDTPSLRGLQQSLASSGVTAVRFNFLYSEKKKKSPDRQPILIDCWRSVADWVRREHSPSKLFLGGRSMGGRMASYLVADGYPADGVFFIAYPLHPPGKRDRQRKDHLPRIGVPMLFVSGTADAFANMDLLEPVVRELHAQVHFIEGADHGFKVPKSRGKTAREIEDEVARTVLAFIQSAGS
ncbi:MAG: alpha/beta hydrolase family protein [Vicinamibacteria bacterium]